MPWEPFDFSGSSGFNFPGFADLWMWVIRTMLTTIEIVKEKASPTYIAAFLIGIGIAVAFSYVAKRGKSEGGDNDDDDDRQGYLKWKFGKQTEKWDNSVPDKTRSRSGMTFSDSGKNSEKFDTSVPKRKASWKNW